MGSDDFRLTWSIALLVVVAEVLLINGDDGDC